MSKDFVIEASHICKSFKKRQVISDLSLSIRKGEIYGFLGPNGAGKTTTIRILLGLLAPDSGYVTMLGQHIRSYSSNCRENIGVMSETSHIHPLMTVREYLEFFRSLYKNSISEHEIYALLETLNLSEHVDRQANTLSTGMKKKLSFIRALINRPDLLILDEPVSSLDPQSIVQVRNVILEEKKRGCSILLSSHILSEMEKIADRIGILDNGIMVTEETLFGLQKKLSLQQEIKIETYLPLPPTTFISESFPEIVSIDQDTTNIIIKGNEKLDYREIAKCIFNNGGIITKLQISQPSLEVSYLFLLEKELSDKGHILHQGS